MNRNLGLFIALGLIMGVLRVEPTQAASVDSVPQSQSKKGIQKQAMGKASGKVEKWDPSTNQIELKAPDGSLRQFRLTSETKILKNGKSATPAQVSKGDKVNLLRYNKNTKEVRRIEIGS